MIEIYPLPAFTDNYIWIIRQDSHIVVVDPGQATPVLKHIDQSNLQLKAIIITHHHQDHVGGVTELVQYSPDDITVYGPKKEAQEVVDIPLSEHQEVSLLNGAVKLNVIEIPGHTLGHIAYFWDGIPNPWLFCGDTLFSGGCGRIFEGTPQQMYASLCKLAAFPPSTRVCCAHEYTESNLAFARTVLPDDVAIATYADKVRMLRKQNRCTLPSTLEIERDINIFLRSTEPLLSQAASLHAGQRVEPGEKTFTALRAWKDTA